MICFASIASLTLWLCPSGMSGTRSRPAPAPFPLPPPLQVVITPAQRQEPLRLRVEEVRAGSGRAAGAGVGVCAARAAEFAGPRVEWGRADEGLREGRKHAVCGEAAEREAAAEQWTGRARRATGRPRSQLCLPFGLPSLVNTFGGHVTWYTPSLIFSGRGRYSPVGVPVGSICPYRYRSRRTFCFCFVVSRLLRAFALILIPSKAAIVLVATHSLRARLDVYPIPHNYWRPPFREWNVLPLRPREWVLRFSRGWSSNTITSTACTAGRSAPALADSAAVAAALLDARTPLAIHSQQLAAAASWDLLTIFLVLSTAPASSSSSPPVARMYERKDLGFLKVAGSILDLCVGIRAITSERESD
ncbi:hypothetical protein K438DRAFT_1926792 [Mycena galopus ATCC 62051]|nr:hypothetical protein K438DRAFT_1926792 [Mycena galopus ATCC 62051]